MRRRLTGRFALHGVRRRLTGRFALHGVRQRLTGRFALHGDEAAARREVRPPWGETARREENRE
jgi:hypothetical protein